MTLPKVVMGMVKSGFRINRFLQQMLANVDVVRSQTSLRFPDRDAVASADGKRIIPSRTAKIASAEASITVVALTVSSVKELLLMNVTSATLKPVAFGQPEYDK